MSNKAAERQRRYRLRKLLGLRQYQVELDDDTIARLRDAGYLTGDEDAGYEIGLFIEDALSRYGVTGDQ